MAHDLVQFSLFYALIQLFIHTHVLVPSIFTFIYLVKIQIRKQITEMSQRRRQLPV